MREPTSWPIIRMYRLPNCLPTLLLRRFNVAGIKFGAGPTWITSSTPATSVSEIASQSNCG